MLPTRTLAGGRTTRPALQLGPNKRPLRRWSYLETLARRRRTFCSDFCVHEWRLRTDPGYLRDQVLKRDRGRCACCRVDTLVVQGILKRSRGTTRQRLLNYWDLPRYTGRSLWEADHIT